MRKQEGITLIALVITIIVLLILAGVSIAMLTGENGILTKATTAKTQSIEAELKEQVSLALGEIIADQETTNIVATAGETVPKMIAAKMTKNGYSTTANESTLTVTKNNKTYTMTLDAKYAVTGDITVAPVTK